MKEGTRKLIENVRTLREIAISTCNEQSSIVHPYTYTVERITELGATVIDGIERLDSSSDEC